MRALPKVTNVVFLGEPAPLGFGLSTTVIAGLYATPIVFELSSRAYLLPLKFFFCI